MTLPFGEGSLVLKRRCDGLGTPEERFMENFLLLNMATMIPRDVYE